ncbi:MAG: DUF2970 domain-containing protein [Flavobacteriaceae bacterium]|nr:DUF2970 domain-containing protein [Flavobacteriaceae bacterium]|tara:strand:- start:12921 stop:13088 length:168 start_codon:yes stop_codon:yes gene_type:complete
MWLKRILTAFLGIRKEKDLSEDLSNLSLKKIILLIISLNVVFIGIVSMIVFLVIS